MVADTLLCAGVDVVALEHLVQPTRPHVDRVLRKKKIFELLMIIGRREGMPGKAH